MLLVVCHFLLAAEPIGRSLAWKPQRYPWPDRAYCLTRDLTRNLTRTLTRSLVCTLSTTPGCRTKPRVFVGTRI